MAPLVMAVAALGAVATVGLHHDKSKPASADFKQPRTLAELLKVPHDQLGKVDIAVMNMLCAEGLPGAENLDAVYDALVLDEWAQEMRRYIASCDEDFLHNPAKFDNNINLSRMTAVVVFLQRIHHIAYDPNRDCFTEPNSVFFANSQDVFIHGLVEGPHFGTCSSIPVLLVAVGRRLGYPLKLVISPHHAFARWESPDGKGSFNIEGTVRYGMGSGDYDHYKKPPYTQPTDDDANSGEYFRPLTPAEELAVFLSSRGYCLAAHQRTAEAEKTFELAASIAPTIKGCARNAESLARLLANNPQTTRP